MIALFGRKEMMLLKLLLFCILHCAWGLDFLSWETEDEDYSWGQYTTQLSPTESLLPTNTCDTVPKGGIPWLLHVRDPDFSWKWYTPRALVALAFTKWNALPITDRQKMELQLDVEITKSLLRTDGFSMLPTRLALFIQALVSLERDPTDFHGLNLVDDLLKSVDRMQEIHPFVLLTLCNARAPLQIKHLTTLEPLTQHKDDEPRPSTELKAIALKAFACASDLYPSLAKFGQAMKSAADCIIRKQRPDGSFGSIYTTALAVQALIASKIPHQSWKKKEAVEYLRALAPVEQTVIGVYSIEMALKADRYPFVKDLHPRPQTRESTPPKIVQVHYTLRNNQRPDVVLMINLMVPKKSTLFDVMNLSVKEVPRFRFSHYLDSDKSPKIYAADDVVNDAEKNFYWRICSHEWSHNSENAMLRTINGSLVEKRAEDFPNIVLWYRDTDCESSNGIYSKR